MGLSNTNLQRILRLFPNFLWPLKVLIVKKSIKSHGINFHIGPNVILANYREIVVGDNVFIGDGTIIGGNVPITIGNNVMFGPEVMVRGGDHNISVVGIPMAKVKEGGKNLPIIIENDVWIGTRAIILKGVKICEGSVIGAGALVNKSTLPYTINVGVPSRAIKCRFSKGNLERHISLIKTNYSFDQILKIYSDNKIEFANG